MSDEKSNQPRKVKDLKARLGRTITTPAANASGPAGVPVPPGAPGAPAAPGAEAGASGAEAGAAGGIPAPALPPPAVPGLGGSPLGAPLPGPKAIVEPPWVKQQREEEEKRKAEEERRKKRAAADPFAAAVAPTGPQAVRIVVDDSALSAAESGQKGRNAVLAVVVTIVALIAMLIGKSLGGIMAARQASNEGLDAAESIGRQVQAGDAVLTAAGTQINKMWDAAKPGVASPRVDYVALEELLRIQNPFRAEHFTATRYNMFDSNTVDALLKYYDATKDVFERADRLARSYNIRSPEGRRQVDASFQAATDFGKYPAGCVPALVGNPGAQRVLCNMVFVELDAATATGVPTRQRPTASPTSRLLFSGQAFPENFDKVVIPVNIETSRDVMGATLHLHDRFIRELGELKAALDEANTARATFRNELNRIRALPRQFTF